MNLLYSVMLIGNMAVYGLYQSHQEPIRESYATLAAHFKADHLHKTLRMEVNNLIGVPHMQSIIDEMEFKLTLINMSLSETIASKLDAAFSRYIKLLKETYKFVSIRQQCRDEGFMARNNIIECARVSPTSLNYEEQFGTRVNLSMACSVPNRYLNSLYHCDRNITSVFQSNAHDEGLRWQYLIDAEGMHIEYPAHIFPIYKRRHWLPFLNAALKHRRRVLILLDTGTIKKKSQLALLKDIARTFIDFALPGDRYMVMEANGKEIRKACDQNNFLDSSSDHLSILSSFINELTLINAQSYSHSKAIHAAYKLFLEEEANTVNVESSDLFYNIMFYISRGIMPELRESILVHNTIAKLIVETNIRVKINTIAVLDDGKNPMLWSLEFLKSIADQNFSNYYQSFPEYIQIAFNESKLTRPSGVMISLSVNDHSSLSLSQVYKMLSISQHTSDEDKQGFKIHWSHPFVEYHSTLISISASLSHPIRLPSIVGMDINIDFIADVMKYIDQAVLANPKYHLRIFFCDLQGRVILDSRFRKFHPWPLHIADLERWPKKDRWLTMHFNSNNINEGSFDVKQLRERKNLTMKFHWKRLKNAPFVVVVAMNASVPYAKISLLDKNYRQKNALENLVYHRLDLQRDSSLPFCVHLGSLSSLKSGSVYLSPNCFTGSSFRKPPSAQWISNYWVYLGDPSGLIRNTGIHHGVREHVAALSSIASYWRDQVNVESNSYIIRRYVATTRGVLITYPATVIRDNYEPDLQAWFVRATKFPGRIVFTGPVLDNEVGKIITVSTAIFEGKANSLHNSNKDQIFAVIAMDIPADFLTKLLRNTLPICKQARRCIIFDELGYVMSRDMTNSKRRKRNLKNDLVDAVEKFHISHLEAQLATHLTTYDQFVEKIQCAQWSTKTLERFFQFNVSFSDAIRIPCDDVSHNYAMPTNLRAEVIPIPQSNIFLALINESCTPAYPIQAFCPCSISDRRCLLCSRFDNADCECPCQCPLDYGLRCFDHVDNESTSKKKTLLHSVDLADVEQCGMPNYITAFGSKPLQRAMLPKCLQINCESRLSIDSCLGLIGCQWCSLDSDGFTLLDNAYCSAVDHCFGGIKGRKIRDLLDISLQVSNQWSVSAPVGPIAAGIMSVFLIVVMTIYCYRSQINRLVETNSLTDSFGTPLCANAIDDDDGPFDFDSNSENKIASLIQLTSFERSSNLPLTNKPQYRVSPRTDSSDQGYSTMTDRMAGDESEYASSSVNLSRKTEQTIFPNLSKEQDSCLQIITTEADIHQVPRTVSLMY